LDEFKEKTNTGNKDDLHRELLEIDKRTQEKAKVKKDVKTSWLDAPADEEKRIQMYKNMRDELLKEESKAKTEA